MEDNSTDLNRITQDLTQFSVELREQLQSLTSKKRKREDGDGDLDILKKELESKLSLIDQKLKDLTGVVQQDEDIVKLNVGGEIFTTSKALLQKYPDSMLGSMFSGRYALKKDETGSYFIDRDPTYFRYILNFYREGTKVVLPSSKEEHEEIAKEVDFYQLNDFVSLLKGSIARDISLGGANVKMRDEENSVRRLFLSDPQQTSNPFLHLIDVYENVESFKFPEKDETTIPLMFTDKRKLGHGYSITPDFKQFQKQFDALTLNIFQDFNWDNVIVAGGSVLAALLPTPPNSTDLVTHYNGTIDNYFEAVSSKNYVAPYDSGFQNSDIDLFLHGLNDSEEALAKVQEIFESIKNAKMQDKSIDEDDSYREGDRKKICVVRTARTITIICGWPRRHVQIVLRLYKSPAEVLLGFDVDCVGVGYNGKKVFCLPRTRRALNLRFNVADPTRQTYRTNTYEYRLWKYARRGFAVAVPGLVRKIINPEVYTKRYSQLKGFSKLLYFEVREKHDERKIGRNHMAGDWLERKGFPTTRENYNRAESLNLLNQDVLSLLNDYNDGLFLCWTPGKFVGDFMYELQVKTNLCVPAHDKAIKNLCFLYGPDVNSILVTDDYIAPGKRQKIQFYYNVPTTIQFIGSLAEYIQSLPDVEDDWFKDVY